MIITSIKIEDRIIFIFYVCLQTLQHEHSAEIRSVAIDGLLNIDTFSKSYGSGPTAALELHNHVAIYALS